MAARVAGSGRAHAGGRLFWGGMKAFADGSLGSRTALMWEPYLDVAAGGAGDVRPTGQRMVDMAQLGVDVEGAMAAGLQVRRCGEHPLHCA